MTVSRVDQYSRALDPGDSMELSTDAEVGDFLTVVFAMSKDTGDVSLTGPSSLGRCGAGTDWTGQSFGLLVTDSNLEACQELTWEWTPEPARSVAAAGLYRDDGGQWVSGGITRNCFSRISPEAGNGSSIVVRGVMADIFGDEETFTYEPEVGDRYASAKIDPIGGGQTIFVALSEEASPASSEMAWEQVPGGVGVDEIAACSWTLEAIDPFPGPFPELSFQFVFPFAPVPQVGPVTPEQPIDRSYDDPVSEPPDPDGIQVPGVPYVNP